MNNLKEGPVIHMTRHFVNFSDELKNKYFFLETMELFVRLNDDCIYRYHVKATKLKQLSSL